jgi:hypothetical protein
MRRLLKIFVTLLALFFTPLLRWGAQSQEPLRLVQTIPMPNVKGRIDHMDVDVRGKRLFVAGLENGSVEIVDLWAGKWTRSIQMLMMLCGFKGIAVTSLACRSTSAWRSRRKTSRTACFT